MKIHEIKFLEPNRKFTAGAMATTTKSGHLYLGVNSQKCFDGYEFCSIGINDKGRIFCFFSKKNENGLGRKITKSGTRGKFSAHVGAKDVLEAAGLSYEKTKHSFDLMRTDVNLNDMPIYSFNLICTEPRKH